MPLVFSLIQGDSLMNELAKVSVVGTSPTRLFRSGTRLRLALDTGELVFIKCRRFRRDRIVYRYPLSQLSLAEHKQVPVTPLHWGPIVRMLQFFRNTHVYGVFDGMAATNLQNLNPSTGATFPVLTLGFHVPGSAYELQVFVVTSRWGNRMPLADCAAYLQGLILKQKRTERMNYGV